MQTDFKSYLEKTQEIGYIEQEQHSIVYVSGLPRARPNEVVLFETGGVGRVLSLEKDYVEVLRLSKTSVNVGTKVARTGRLLQVRVGDDMLGRTVDALGRIKGKSFLSEKNSEVRLIDVTPPRINVRRNIDKPFNTGITLVDLIVPLGKGQRELVVGDRKTGKTQLLLQTTLTQARKGTVCIYCAIAKKRLDVKMIEEFIAKNKISQNTIIVASSSAQAAGLVFTAPYTAMTIAEYFRDRGKDVFIALDDMSAHAKYYREIKLLAKHFPGRSAYPGDIFYVHSRLLERAGNFVKDFRDENGKVVQKDVSITCIPVAELVMGDLSGYIQTNLMAMTDGHVFFDSDLFNQGRRPAVNPFLSVTRVGRQAQTPLMRDINRQITKFLVYLERLREFMHFGAELSESTKRTLALGDRITAFFDQPFDQNIEVNINVALLSGLWGGFWKDKAQNVMKQEMQKVIEKYQKDEGFKSQIDNMIASSKYFADLVTSVKNIESTFMANVGTKK